MQTYFTGGPLKPINTMCSPIANLESTTLLFFQEHVELNWCSSSSWPLLIRLCQCCQASVNLSAHCTCHDKTDGIEPVHRDPCQRAGRCYPHRPRSSHACRPAARHTIICCAQMLHVSYYIYEETVAKFAV